MTPRLSRSAFAPVCCALACLLGPGSAFADTAVLTSVDDNTIIEDPAGFWSAGAAQYFFAGKVGVNGGNTVRRGALRFDLSGIPAGSTITSVSLRMYCSAAGLTSAQAVALKRFTASWGEGGSVAFGGGGAFAQQNDTTWLHRLYPNTFWATPGGEFTSTVTVSRTVNGIGTYTWASTPQFVADVQDMVNNPSTNYGWCVQGNEGVNQSVKRFDSHESGVVSTRPQLTVEFTPPPANPSDLTGDGKVNAEDLAVLLSSWGTSGSADITGDGTVNGADLGVLLSSWTG